MNFLRNIFINVLDFFFPSHCFNCGQALENGRIICEKCEKDIERTSENICLLCGEDKNNCKCKNTVYYFSKACAPFYNCGIAQNGVYLLKFHGKTCNAQFFADEMVKCVQSQFKNVEFDCVCNVPAHPFKVFKRGYDQSQLLAQIIADRLNVKYQSGVLARKIFSKTQHKTKGVSARFINAYNSYFQKRKINCNRILLVDDIKTSGASLSACARSLLYAGAKEVYCVTSLVSKVTVEKRKNI